MASLSEKIVNKWINVWKFTRNSLNFLACCVTHHVLLLTFDLKKKKKSVCTCYLLSSFSEKQSPTGPLLTRPTSGIFKQIKKRVRFLFLKWAKVRHWVGWWTSQACEWLNYTQLAIVYLFSAFFFFYYYYSFPAFCTVPREYGQRKENFSSLLNL
jgi:hypothetical protein